MLATEFIVIAFFALFATVDPVGNIPFYVTLTEGLSKKVRRRIIKKTIMVASLTLLAAAAFGNTIFALFGITIPAFKIAGGLLLLAIAFSMLHGEKPRTKQTRLEKEEVLEKMLQGDDVDESTPGEEEVDPEVEAVAVVPLGIPLFAGPGGISTAILLVASGAESLSGSGTGIFDPLVMSTLLMAAAILTIMLLSYVLLIYADPLFERIGRTGALAFSRIFGLILAAIAVQLMVDGVADLIPVFMKAANGVMW